MKKDKNWFHPYVQYKTKGNKWTNKILNKNKLRDTDNRMVISRGEGGEWRTQGVKGVKYKVTERDQTLGGGNTIEQQRSTFFQ